MYLRSGWQGPIHPLGKKLLWVHSKYDLPSSLRWSGLAINVEARLASVILGHSRFPGCPVSVFFRPRYLSVWLFNEE